MKSMTDLDYAVDALIIETKMFLSRNKFYALSRDEMVPRTKLVFFCQLLECPKSYIFSQDGYTVS